jgi:transposase
MNKLNAKDKIKLISIHRKEKDKRLADRIKAIILLDNGMKYEEIAKVLFLNDSTIRRFEWIFYHKGIEAILSLNYNGRPFKLVESQISELKQHLSDTTYLNVKSIIEYVKRKYNVEYTKSGMKFLLHALDFEYKKPKIISDKVNVEMQIKFVEKYKKLKKTPDIEILFMDATHPQHNSRPTFGWFPKKKRNIKLLNNSGMKRINIHGILNINSKEISINRYDTINEFSVVDSLKEIERNYSKSKKIIIICDNAKYYHSRYVSEYLKKSKIELMFLPSYSPNLNLIERAWRFFHKKITAMKYFSSFIEFEKSVLNFFSNIKEFELELSTLLTENFQILIPPVSQIKLA